MDNQSLLDNINFQFTIAKQLLDYHLSSLEQEEYIWCSPKSSLNIKEVDGKWEADLPDTEAYDIGPPSIAWTLWHITYWWEMVIDHSFGEGRLKKEDIKVIPDVKEIKRHIESLITRWEKILDQLVDDQLHSKKLSSFPFYNKVEFHKLAAWLNLELMKNAAEVGYARFVYGAEINEPGRKHDS